jgi:hypothetical protein
MPDDRAASEAARRQKAAARRGASPLPTSLPPVVAQPQRVPQRRPTALRIVGWAAYVVALAIFVVFVVQWVHDEIPVGQQLYPLPGIAAAFLIIGIWTILGPSLYNSRSTATRAGKYVLAVVVTIIFYPLIVTGISSLAQWVVSLIPGSPLH